MAGVIVEDTRQKPGAHDAKHEWWSRNGFTIVRSKLAFGDYCLPPEAAVDTKASILELAQDVERDHARFRRELEGARDAGCKLYVLVENDDGVCSLDDLEGWVEGNKSFNRRRAKRRIYGKRIAKACRTMEERYGATFLFCPPEASAEIVTSILEGGEHAR